VDDFLATFLEDCDFTVNPAVASGVVHVMNHDNSLPGYSPLWHRTNAWGYHLPGELTRADGGRAHFSYVVELPFGANGAHTYQEHLVYKPIGEPQESEHAPEGHTPPGPTPGGAVSGTADASRARKWAT
jgi:hypothetical protein